MTVHLPGSDINTMSVEERFLNPLPLSTTPIQRTLQPYNYEDSDTFLDYHKFLLRSNFIPQFVLNYLYKWYNDNHTKFRVEEEKGLINSAHVADSNEFRVLSWVFNVLTPRVESLTKSKLIPVYNYGRVYKNGSEMYPHLDRAQCDVSVTFPIAYDKDPWPILVHPPYTLSPTKVVLVPGQALIYRGGELVHWREPNTSSEVQYQHFFHWIDTSTECGSFMAEFSKEEILNPRLWPGSFYVMKEKGMLPIPRKKNG